VAILGLTFKENVPDIRNSRVPDIIQELQSYGVEALVHDPLADPAQALRDLGIHLRPWDELADLDGLLLAVPHRFYLEDGAQSIPGLLRKQAVVVDLKAVLDPAGYANGAMFGSL